MSFLKNIMSPFLEFKEKDVKPDSNQAQASKRESRNYSGAEETAGLGEVAAPTSASRSTGSVKQGARADHYQYFEDLIEDANAKNPLFQGTDFKEFIDSKVDVEAIADEGTRYKTAFNVLKRTGLTKDRLVATGEEYLNIIERDLKGFEDAYSQQYKKEVEQKELQLQQKAEELHELNEKISALNQDIKKVSMDITQSREHLNANKDAFMMAGENKKKEIQTELQKIEQYF